MNELSQTETQFDHGPAAKVSRADRDQLGRAMRDLESALSSPAPTRERQWLADVKLALGVLEGAMQEQWSNAEAAGGLLAGIAREEPRFESRVAELRNDNQGMLRQIASLREMIDHDDPESLPEFTEIRHRIRDLISSLRYHQTREVDLIYEAINTDIGEMD